MHREIEVQYGCLAAGGTDKNAVTAAAAAATATSAATAAGVFPLMSRQQLVLAGEAARAEQRGGAVTPTGRPSTSIPLSDLRHFKHGFQPTRTEWRRFAIMKKAQGGL